MIALITRRVGLSRDRLCCSALRDVRCERHRRPAFVGAVRTALHAATDDLLRHTFHTPASFLAACFFRAWSLSLVLDDNLLALSFFDSTNASCLFRRAYLTLPLSTHG